MFDRAKARMVAVGYSSEEGIDYVEEFVSAVSDTWDKSSGSYVKSDRRGFEPFGCRPDFPPVEVGHRYLLMPAPDCGAVSGKAAQVSRRLHTA